MSEQDAYTDEPALQPTPAEVREQVERELEDDIAKEREAEAERAKREEEAAAAAAEAEADPG